MGAPLLYRKTEERTFFAHHTLLNVAELEIDAAARLDGFTALAMSTKPWHLKQISLLRRYGMNAGPAAANLKKLLA
jgi:hypothetical protein